MTFLWLCLCGIVAFLFLGAGWAFIKQGCGIILSLTVAFMLIAGLVLFCLALAYALDYRDFCEWQVFQAYCSWLEGLALAETIVAVVRVL